jgi:hypothetical protein
MAAGIPREVTLAQRVADEEVILVAVGEVTVGMASAKQIVPFHVVPVIHDAVAVALLSSTELLYKKKVLEPCATA